MVKIIKKFLGMCEHNWSVECITKMAQREESYKCYAMCFEVNLLCDNCGKIATEKSKLFSKTDIANDYCSLKKKHHWDTIDDCINKLQKTPNANTVKKSFAIKLNKKYNLNLTIDDFK